MTRAELTELIRDELNQAVIDIAKNKITPPQSSTNKKEISEDDAYEMLFYGGVKPKDDNEQKTPIMIQEQEMPKITSTEVQEFEHDFYSFASNNNTSVVFDKQSNGKSIILFKKPSGFEAYSSGMLDFGNKGNMYWVFSLRDGLKIGTKSLSLTHENRNLISELYNFFETWQESWRGKLMGVKDTEKEPQGGQDISSGTPANDNSPLAGL